jgi:hypothetical protein
MGCGQTGFAKGHGDQSPRFAPPSAPRQFCLPGKSVLCSVVGLSSPISKNILLRGWVETAIHQANPVPIEGRFAIVTDAGWDAVDVMAPLTNGAKADGEVVWS